jgi:hypothetical protein
VSLPFDHLWELRRLFSWARPFSWLHKEVFEYESASAPVKRTTTTKARYLALRRSPGSDSDNFVCGPALGAIEQYGFMCGHAGKLELCGSSQLEAAKTGAQEE